MLNPNRSMKATNCWTTNTVDLIYCSQNLCIVCHTSCVS